MSDCGICYRSLLLQQPVSLTYLQQQRLRFFNSGYQADIYDIVGINSENIPCPHRFHLHCLVQFHSNFYLQDFSGDEGEVFICPAVYCRAYISGPGGFQVMKYNEYIRQYSPTDSRIPIFSHPDVVDLTNDFIHGRTNIWEWNQPIDLTGINEPVASSSTDDLTELIASLENVGVEDVMKAATILDDSDGEMMDVEDQVENVIDCLDQLDLSPPTTPSYAPLSPDFSPPGTPACSPIPHSPPPSPTPSTTSTVALDRNFRVVGEMMRHMEDEYLLSVGWTLSTTIHRAEGGVYIQFFHGFPLNPHTPTLTDQVEQNATYAEYMEDVNDHMNDVMWSHSMFDPYVSVYRVATRHIVAIFAAFPRGVPMQYHPISFPKKQYIF